MTAILRRDWLNLVLGVINNRSITTVPSDLLSHGFTVTRLFKFIQGFRLSLLMVFYIACNDISVIYVTAQMCRRIEEEVGPTVRLPTP